MERLLYPSKVPVGRLFRKQTCVSSIDKNVSKNKEERSRRGAANRQISSHTSSQTTPQVITVS